MSVPVNSNSNSKVALVTGASKGIGRAIAVRLARDGFRIALNDLPSAKEELERLANEIMIPAGTVTVHFADVSVEEEVMRMVGEVVDVMGGIDVMVANAGICITKPFLETTKEDYDRLFGINVQGTFFCYKHAAVQMIKQGRGGRIIGAASVVSKQGNSLLAAYSASKFAIRGMTQSAAIELAKHKITVNAYAPGGVTTDLLKDLRVEFQKDLKKATPDAVTTMKSHLGRDSSPEDIAGLVSFLASKDSEMITGQSISINGGMFFD